jgi:hypothetical protein
LRPSFRMISPAATIISPGIMGCPFVMGLFQRIG